MFLQKNTAKPKRFDGYSIEELSLYGDDKKPKPKYKHYCDALEAIKEDDQLAFNTALEQMDNIEPLVIDDSLLQTAVNSLRPNMVKSLLERGANPNEPNYFGNSALDTFIDIHTNISSDFQDHYFQIFELLIQHQANFNSTKVMAVATETPLHVIAYKSTQNNEDIYCKLAQIIVENGGDVNAQDSSYKHTPLRHAAQQGSTRMATYLLTQKANPHMTTTDGQTPLQIAQRYGRVTVVAVLEQAQMGSGPKKAVDTASAAPSPGK